jgi:hypothetical protein
MAGRVTRAAAICCLAGGWVSSAAASDSQDRRYETVWNIELDQSQTGIRSVTVDQPVLEQRLLPFGLAVTEEDIRSETGDVLVEKGRQLFQLQVAQGKTFCLASVPRPSAFRTIMLGGGNLQLCLIDSDADGTFDGHFNGGNPMRGVPFIKGRQPANPKRASGKYSLLAPDQFALRYTVRILLSHARMPASGEPLIVYRIDFGDDQTRQGLTSAISGTLGHMSILGAQWEARAIDGSTAKIEVISPMPNRPFQVERSVSYR